MNNSVKCILVDRQETSCCNVTFQPGHSRNRNIFKHYFFLLICPWGGWAYFNASFRYASSFLVALREAFGSRWWCPPPAPAPPPPPPPGRQFRSITKMTLMVDGFLKWHVTQLINTRQNLALPAQKKWPKNAPKKGPQMAKVLLN